ncbi:uncharacterized protein [Onthophagus taurus]|uniref:uncharacterized protein n=1 Tax=Onthophagus taurus TaxID=166361 RepID=UPI000C2070F8|nr:trihydrophobin-like [Onthophagus taurus]
MFVKLAVFACSLAFAAAAWNGPLAGGVPAHQFPAGVSPESCPNFPNCNNPAVAVQANAGAHAGGWNAGNNGAWNGGNNGAWNGGNNGAWNGGHNGGWNGGNNGAWNGGNNGAWNGGNNGGWNGGNEGGYTPNNALDAGEYTGDGDYRGEGLQEAGAYGDVSQDQSQWNNNDGGWNGGHNNGGWNGGWNNAAPAYNQGAGAQVPAGVDGHSCPNYPFCH